MKKLQKNWQLIAASMVLFVGGGGLLWQRVAGGAALVQEPPAVSATTAFQRDAVLNILGEISLDREALVALNVTAAQADSLLQTAVTWQGQNAATLETLKLSVDRKVSAARKLDKAIRMGTAGEGSNAQRTLAYQELTDARTAQRSGLASLETSVGALLSSSQQATWAAIKKGHGRSMPNRMLDLTNEQRLAVSHAERTYKRQRAAAGSKAVRLAAVATREAALDGIFTVDQKNVRQAYGAYYSTASTAVAGAFEAVLTVDEG